MSLYLLKQQIINNNKHHQSSSSTGTTATTNSTYIDSIDPVTVTNNNININVVNNSSINSNIINNSVNVPFWRFCLDYVSCQFHGLKEVQRRTGWELLCNLEAARYSCAHPSVMVFSELLLQNNDSGIGIAASLQGNRNYVHIVLYTRQCLLGGMRASCSAPDEPRRRKPSPSSKSASIGSASTPTSRRTPVPRGSSPASDVHKRIVPTLYEAKVEADFLERAARAAIGNDAEQVLNSVLNILRRRQSIIANGDSKKRFLAYVLPLIILEVYQKKRIIDDSVSAHCSAGLYTAFHDEIVGSGSPARTDVLRSFNARTLKLLSANGYNGGKEEEHTPVAYGMGDSEVTSSIGSQSAIDSDTNTSLLDAMEDMCTEIQSEYINGSGGGTNVKGSQSNTRRNPRTRTRGGGASEGGAFSDERRTSAKEDENGDVSSGKGARGHENDMTVAWASSQVQYALRLLCGEYASLALSAATSALAKTATTTTSTDTSSSPSSSATASGHRDTAGGDGAHIDQEMISDMKLQARSMLYKEAVTVLGSVEAKLYYAKRFPDTSSTESLSELERCLMEIASHHPVPPPRKNLVYISKLIVSANRDAFEPLVAWLVAYAAELS